MDEKNDILVVGGGPVGNALALALDRHGQRVTLLEAKTHATAGDDARTLALSHGSRLILERLGLWPLKATPIRQIFVSQRGGFGRVELNADKVGVAALGHVVEYGELQRALAAAVQASGVILETGCTALAVDGDDHRAVVTIEQADVQRDLRAGLAVVADGGAGLKLSQVKNHDYGQSALVCDVVSAQPHHNRAFERFTEEGPLALLPHREGWSLVWTARPQRVAELAALDDAEFCARLGEVAGFALGAFAVRGPRQVFPLRLKVAGQPLAPRCVLIGNAAQTLHPVAGQGFNLGLRDAFELARLIAAHGAPDPGAPSLLNTFFAQRRFDRTATILFTDSLIRLFSNDIPLLKSVRGLGLAALGAIPAAANFLARRMIFGARG